MMAVFMATLTSRPGEPRLRRVHLIGIGGSGMSALARLYLQQGLEVSGSDEVDSAELRTLAALGATVHVGHDAAHIGGADLVVYSSAVPESNPELAAARRHGRRTLKHAQALGELFNTRRGIAVAGTHGKTTTSSMTAFVLDRCGVDVSFQIGGELVDLSTSARWGTSPWMVIEADEFDRRFLEYRPEVAIVTNVEPDHFEYYASVAEMVGAYADFLARVRPTGTVIACVEDATLAGLLEDVHGRRVVRYGWLEPAVPSQGSPRSRAAGPLLDWAAGNVVEVPGGSRFEVWHHTPDGATRCVPAQLVIPGRHHVLNALAALAACTLVGVELEEAVRALGTFHGARRRFELTGAGRGIRVYSDYAHHPTEVRANVAAARSLVPAGGRLWAVFQPHLYSRTEALFDEFARAFEGADQVVLCDVYSPSGREPARAARGSRELAAAMRHPGARYAGTMEAALDLLRRELWPGDLVLVMGAGPIDRLARELGSELGPAAGKAVPSTATAGSAATKGASDAG